jgi:dipeptidyl aminopeptidase/acylaminoacyl peptidase
MARKEGNEMRFTVLLVLACFCTILALGSIMHYAACVEDTNSVQIGTERAYLEKATENNSSLNDSDAEFGGVDLIPRKVIFGNPDRTRVLISSDGRWIGYMAPLNGVLNVWVAPIDNLSSARPVTNDTLRGIHYFTVAYTNHHVIYTQDTNGDENWKVYCVDLLTGERKNLTPLQGVNAQVLHVSDSFPQEILVGLNNRDPERHDLYAVNITTGARRLIMKNENFSYIGVDNDYNPRLTGNATPEGGEVIYYRPVNGTWVTFMNISPEDDMTTGPIRFDRTSETLYLYDSRGRETSALVEMNMTTGETKILAEDARADIDGTIAHPVKRTPQAASFTYEHRQWKILDSSIAKDMEYLDTLEDGEFNVYQSTLDDRHWMVACNADNGPINYYCYDRNKGVARFLFADRESLNNYTLAKMHPVIIKSRDGLNLVSYYTLPVWSDKDGNGLPDKPLPMVLLVHGGPWERDTWGFDSEHQLWANRGYAVLSVNFRGSTGFGKSFVNAADRQWGAKMHDDLIDAVNWSIEKGIADPKRVAIFGGSYGGYAALVGLTFTPEVFACGVDICGVSNLVTDLKSIPPYWKPEIEKDFKRIGDYRTAEGEAFLMSRSPISYVDRIEKPLLMAHGANDPRVKQNESEQIADAMKEKNISVTYVLYPDEGHGFARPENRLSFYAIAEAFLAEHLGGRYQPVGDDFSGANITVPLGKDDVPGLSEALDARL